MVKIIASNLDCGIIAMDSVACVNESHKGSIITTGSHGGESAAKQLLKFEPAGVIFNDAGKGKEGAGIKGLLLFERADIPAATVETFSARIGDGMDTYESGIISAVNESAKGLNIVVGMTAREAAKTMQKRTQKEGLNENN